MRAIFGARACRACVLVIATFCASSKTACRQQGGGSQVPPGKVAMATSDEQILTGRVVDQQPPQGQWASRRGASNPTASRSATCA